MEKKDIVIVGNGIAAVGACQSLRENGFGGVIRVFSSGELPVYNPMLTSYYAAGKIDYSMLFPYGESKGIFDKYGVILHLNSPVVKLSAEKHSVTTLDGAVFEFAKCLVATGASPFIPPIEGRDSPKIFTMRTVEDAVKLKAFMERKPKKAIVIGASMVGIKLVELLWEAGAEVLLADMAPRIFPLAAHAECSRVIENRLRDKGIKLKFSAAIEKVIDTSEGIEVRFQGDIESAEADLLLMCIGVRANTGFIDPKEVALRQGILIDSHMESSTKDIYGAGDAAEGMNLQRGAPQIIGILANARRQGRTAGCNMAGVPREHAGEILHNITHFMDMNFVGIGEVTEYDRYETFDKGSCFAQIFYKDERICGANFLDLFTEAGVFKNLIGKNFLPALPLSFSKALPNAWTKYLTQLSSLNWTGSG
jgi:3-phenylpropionate/trans-cinnamate dioxygenase ferredoxin reductase subunit